MLHRAQPVKSRSGERSGRFGLLNQCPRDSPALRMGKVPRRRHSSVVSVGEEFVGLTGMTYLMKPEVATLFSAVIAVSSVGLNLYGSLLTEKRKSEIQRETEREKLILQQRQELRSVLARYRGPLLEATFDFEQRVYHLLVQSEGLWSSECDGPGCSEGVNDEEVLYSLFTLAQFLGFVEVVRREGPRERSFLQHGNPQGTDTLATLVEGFRFAMCADAEQLLRWNNFKMADGRSEHPGCRSRVSRLPTFDAGNRRSTSDGNGSHDAAATPPTPSSRSLRRGYNCSIGDGASRDSGRSLGSQTQGPVVPNLGLSTHEVDGLHVSRGMQRAIGALMVVTPVGANRHYTMSYADFYRSFQTDPYMAGWFKPLYEDMVGLLRTGERWKGQPTFPFHRWSRLLLVQQLLIETMDLLDPIYVRVPLSRRVKLSPIDHAPLPNVQEYRERILLLEAATDSMMGFDAAAPPVVLPASIIYALSSSTSSSSHSSDEDVADVLATNNVKAPREAPVLKEVPEPALFD